MNILIAGDSLSLPRGHKGQSVDDTWPSLLHRDLGAYVWNRSRPSATSRTVLASLNELEFYCAHRDARLDAIMVQVGIVDATPRDLGYAFERLLLLASRGHPRIIKAARQAGRLLPGMPRPWIGQRQFADNAAAIIRSAARSARTVLLIAIAPPCHYLTVNVPRVAEKVEQYNALLRSAVAAASASYQAMFVDPWNDLAVGELDALFLDDGHHLSAAGHHRVSRALAAYLDRNAADPLRSCAQVATENALCNSLDKLQCPVR